MDAHVAQTDKSTNLETFWADFGKCCMLFLERADRQSENLKLQREASGMFRFTFTRLETEGLGHNVESYEHFTEAVINPDAYRKPGALVEAFQNMRQQVGASW
jgi:hypothetical protein